MPTHVNKKYIEIKKNNMAYLIYGDEVCPFKQNKEFLGVENIGLEPKIFDVA